MWVCRFGTPLLAHQPSHSRHSHARSRPLAQLRQGALLHWGLAKEPFKNTSKPQQMLEASWNDMQTLTTLERASRANGIPPEPTISKKWTKMKKELKRYRLRQLRISRKDARRDFFETSRCEALNLRFINASIISHDYTIVRVYVLVSLNWQKFWGTVFQQMHYKNANCTHHTPHRRRFRPRRSSIATHTASGMSLSTEQEKEPLRSSCNSSHPRNTRENKKKTRRTESKSRSN